MSWWFAKNMKWQKSSADFLSEKTFLIIKDNLESLEAKETSSSRKKTICAGNTGTWPPKVKKISSKQNVTERPKTANLEKPSVLNPDLVDKLDMSLLSKELFCDSMSRIQLGALSGGGASSTSSSSSRRRRIVPIDTELHRHTRISFSKRSTRKKRSSFQHTIDDFSRVDLTHLEPSSTQKLPKSGRKTDRRLDNNNNGSGSSLQSKITNLTKLQRKSIKHNVSSDVELFTAYVKRVAEPCTTCGRLDQPERFHSHPKAPALKIKPGGNNLGLSKISVPKKSIQKPVALNFRSDKSKNRIKKDLEAKAMSNCKSKTPSPLSKKDCPGNPSKVGGTVTPVIRGPRTVTCYICSREFGTASFPIHEPKCLQRWERENKTLPPSQRRSVPQRPNMPIDHQDWNTTAWERSQTQLVPCSRCGRTFLPDRLIIHQNSCKIGSNNSEIENRDMKPSSTRILSGPPTVVCEICGRNFGTRSIKIHEPQCLKKWQFENDKLPRSQGKGDPPKRGQLLSRSEDSISLRKLSTESLHKKAFTCYICNRNFGSASIVIHESQCLKKWHVENNKLPLQKRRQEPHKPDDNSLRDSSSENSILTPAELAEISWKQHLNKLVPCKRCGRTFNPERVSVHERSCKGTR